MARKPISELLGNVTRFGKLTVLHEVDNGKSDRQVCCQCDCGATKVVYAGHLRRGNTRSCGCDIVIGKRKHGQFYHPMYARWNAMVQRCSNPANKDYPNYGGRGIRVCGRWKEDPAAFFADMGDCPEGMSIDRIDPDGPYSPENCRWAGDKTQAQNQRRTKTYEFRGRRVCLTEACRMAGLEDRFFAIYARVKAGKSLEDAMRLEWAEG